MHIDMTHLMEKRQIKSADRQELFRKRMSAAGMVQVSGWVHGHQGSDVVQLMKRLRADGDLTAGPVRNVVSGKLEKLER